MPSFHVTQLCFFNQFVVCSRPKVLRVKFCYNVTFYFCISCLYCLFIPICTFYLLFFYLYKFRQKWIKYTNGSFVESLLQCVCLKAVLYSYCNHFYTINTTVLKPVKSFGIFSRFLFLTLIFIDHLFFIN